MHNDVVHLLVGLQKMSVCSCICHLILNARPWSFINHSDVLDAMGAM